MMIDLVSMFSSRFTRDFEARRDAATRRIVARHARGDALLSMGRYLGEADMAALRIEGDAAAARLARRVRRAGAPWYRRPWVV